MDAGRVNIFFAAAEPAAGGRGGSAPLESNEALLGRIAEGDRHALKELYDQTAGRLLAIALRMLGNRPLAEEAVQDAFLAIWNSAARFDPARGAASAWITTILRRKVIDRLRASPWLLRETEFDDQGAVTADCTLQMAVRQCLDQLGSDHRTSLLYVYFFGLTHAELSEKLQKPLGTVKSWVRRALLDLTRCLEQ